MEQMIENAIAQLQDKLPDLTAFGLKVLACIFVYFVGTRLIRVLIRFVRRVMERSRLPEGTITFTSSLIKIVFYITLILWIAVQFGLEESSVAALVASGGVGIGLALQGGLSNLAGGVQIMTLQPFRVGDYIISQGQEGTVQRIEILHTTLVTLDNRKVILPNGNLANNVIVNVTASESRQLEWKIGITYDSNLNLAKEILMETARKEEAVKKEEIRVFVAELAESSVVIGLRCWVPTESYFPVLWQLNEKIKKEYDQAGIRIAYPQVEVHVRE